MSISITGGVHLGANDGTPYLSLHAQIGTLPTINLDLGPGLSPIASVGLVGGFLGGEVLTSPSIIPPTTIADQLATLDSTTLHLGGTMVEVPVVLTNPYLLT